MSKISIAEPDLMNITNTAGETFIGGSQDWYTDSWHKKSGCGPVAACNLMWYLFRKNNLKSDYPDSSDYSDSPAYSGYSGYSDYLNIMTEMFGFVTPTFKGVDSSDIFVNGIMNYTSKHNIIIKPYTLEIPKKKGDRPNDDALKEFISTALKSDSPVAFLNLSNGTVSLLENWHWVTIIAIDPDTMMTDIIDYGKIITINISEWLKTSMLGGALVYLKEAEQLNENV